MASSSRSSWARTPLIATADKKDELISVVGDFIPDCLEVFGKWRLSFKGNVGDAITFEDFAVLVS
jgi:hypothetical protein